MDAVIAHARAVGSGSDTGEGRFSVHRQKDPSSSERWGKPWFTGAGSCHTGCGPGDRGDGWGGRAGGEDEGGSGGDGE
ncbi:hypothetical protein AN216_22870 [Streptomyces oceani]|uniref:Uncharacterized protein n=1 Tax=Streptomyces oceani TaxID=1075402 RepID=A0A1E7JWD6_9ACTN|nr:hypothetical protein AN216_22870 [Streptomyces oceani]